MSRDRTPLGQSPSTALGSQYIKLAIVLFVLYFLPLVHTHNTTSRFSFLLSPESPRNNEGVQV